MMRDRIPEILSWVGWAIVVGLAIIVALLWTRMERQVVENQANITALQAYADRRAAQVREENAAAQARLESRWRNYLMPLLRQHHETLASIPDVREPMPPLPEWLKETP